MTYAPDLPFHLLGKHQHPAYLISLETENHRFASTTASIANLLYHLAICRLIQVHPSQTNIDLSTSSATAICGIMAYTEDSVVPSVGLPALRVAGECLTGLNQQNEVLELLDKFRRNSLWRWQMTNWREELKAVWKRGSHLTGQVIPNLSLSKLESPSKLAEVPHSGPYVHARAMYSYVPKDESGLGFAQGDLIQVLKRSDNGWWEGSLRGRTGLFPSGHCDVISDGKKSLSFDRVSPQQPQSSLEVARQRKTNWTSKVNTAQGTPRSLKRVGRMGREESQELRRKLEQVLEKAQNALSFENSQSYDDASDAYMQICGMLQDITVFDVRQRREMEVKQLVSTRSQQMGNRFIDAHQNTSAPNFFLE